MNLPNPLVLVTIRDLFTGKRKRAQLHDQKPGLTELVCIGQAIILACGDKYLKDDMKLKGGRNAYGELLVYLLSAGFPQRRKAGGHLDPPTADALVSASRRAKLHNYEGQHTVLTPPPELIKLVTELGRTEAIDAFFADIEKAVTASGSAKDESEARQGEERRRNYIRTVIQYAETYLDRDGLLEVIKALNQRLGRHDEN